MVISLKSDKLEKTQTFSGRGTVVVNCSYLLFINCLIFEFVDQRDSNIGVDQMDIEVDEIMRG